MEIIPAIMPRTIEELKEKVSLVVGEAPFVQIDIMDGVFVPGKTWPYTGFDLDMYLNEESGLPFWEDINYEFDLMIASPENHVEKYAMTGASRIIFHIESSKNIEEAVKLSKKYDIETGIAVNIDTPTENIESVLEEVDFVQFMGIKTIGLQGQPFDERVLEKIKSFRQKFPTMIISVDGGVNLNSVPHLIEAGASRLVAGSAVFEGGIVKENIEYLKGIKS